ncbi:hypothetical protein BROOK1789C_214 [Bathymodiolus brooksi thiotrophic gill symbiont]|jgi:hypothetical protein|nr:hypothetical protein BROOK1789C_214 [Bathymodiolus brooksi thiotrophic gill symbiont]CAC9604637.1 hypothetical protein [uncultured Gammaproteobacteria bacterium]CAC9969147.1 hypothetical protein [uncultured Gammaproteobacteria bacterium]SHE19168.1 hypothetical protein BBROOKSOX_513 [Bathymodiolus brooksi thiotrophic gill symbiont]
MKNFVFFFLIALDLKNIQLRNTYHIPWSFSALTLLKRKILVFIRMKDLAL